MADITGGTDPLVLVVDDDSDLRDAVRQTLEDDGFEVVDAGDGRAALELLRGGVRPRVILLDLWMPVMDGWQLLDTLAGDPVLSGIPILILTAAPGVDASSLGVQAVLRKPISGPRLLAALAPFR